MHRFQLLPRWSGLAPPNTQCTELFTDVPAAFHHRLGAVPVETQGYCSGLVRCLLANSLFLPKLTDKVPERGALFGFAFLRSVILKYRAATYKIHETSQDCCEEEIRQYMLKLMPYEQMQACIMKMPQSAFPRDRLGKETKRLA